MTREEGRRGTPGPGGEPDRDELLALAREAARFVPDAVGMLRGVLTDDRVPRSAKVQTAAMLAYVVSPIDVVPDFIPVLGQLDDAALAALAVRRLLASAGEDVVRDHWGGSERGLQLLLGLASALAVPSRALRRLGVAAALGGIVRGGRGGAGRGPRVVDGEVVPPRDPPRRPGR